MEYEQENLEQQMVELCNRFIDIFDNLKSNGLISQEEYLQHTSLKKLFISRFNNEIC